MPPLQVPLQGCPLITPLVITKFPFTLSSNDVFYNDKFDLMCPLQAFLLQGAIVLIFLGTFVAFSPPPFF